MPQKSGKSKIPLWIWIVILLVFIIVGHSALRIIMFPPPPPEDVIDIEMSAYSPTLNKPITLSREKIYTRPGQEEGIKIKTFNIANVNYGITTGYGIAPVIKCFSPDGVVKFAQKSVTPYVGPWKNNEELPFEFEYRFTTHEDTEPDETYICYITMYECKLDQQQNIQSCEKSLEELSGETNFIIKIKR